jgi:hypothetical protein
MQVGHPGLPAQDAGKNNTATMTYDKHTWQQVCLACTMIGSKRCCCQGTNSCSKPRIEVVDHQQGLSSTASLTKSCCSACCGRLQV